MKVVRRHMFKPDQKDITSEKTLGGTDRTGQAPYSKANASFRAKNINQIPTNFQREPFTRGNNY